MIFLIFLLAASTAPFIFGRYGEELCCLILTFVQSSVIILLFRFVPLSVIIRSGIPYRQMRLHLMNRATTCRGEKSLSFFRMRQLMPSLGSSAQKMIFLLYGPNFLLFPKEEKEKSCNNLKVGGEIFGKRVGYTKGRY